MVAEALEEGGELLVQEARSEFWGTRLHGGGEGLAAPHASDDGVSWMVCMSETAQRALDGQTTHWKRDVRVYASAVCWPLPSW